MSHQYPDGAGARKGALPTSKRAADEIEKKGRAKLLRTRCMEWFEAGHQGTADDCASALGEIVFSIRPRITELRQKGLIEPTGQRRDSINGSRAAIMRKARPQLEMPLGANYEAIHGRPIKTHAQAEAEGYTED